MVEHSRSTSGRSFSHDGAKQLLALYDIKETDDNSDVLEKIWQFDIGFFFSRTLSVPEGPDQKIDPRHTPGTSSRFWAVTMSFYRIKWWR